MDKALSNYRILIAKLDKFIRRYYINKIIRGSIYFLTLVIVLFLIFNLLESQFYFNKQIRKFIFYGFILTSLVALGGWIIYPLAKYFQLGKTISREQAAKIIGSHFSNVQDKLLNVLQLYNQATRDSNNELLFASIDQKSDEIKLVPFKSAINLAKNKKYLKYLIPPALILLLLLLVAPGMIKSSTVRIINNDKDYTPPAPFHFKILNDKLETVQFDDFDLVVTTEGEYVPDEVYVDIGGYKYRLTKAGNGSYNYKFKNVQKDINFKLFAGKVTSPSYTLEVIPKPVVTQFAINLKFPSYIKRKNTTVSNTGDLVVPEGTKANWEFDTKNTDTILVKFGDGSKATPLNRLGANRYTFSKILKRNDIYKLYIKNKKIQEPDSVAYAITVIKDKYPEITMQQFRDSLDENVLYFIGNASDDYGFTSLSFNYSISDEGGTQLKANKVKLDLKPGRNITFKHFFDINESGIKPGQVLKYYFEVFDNDAVNGPKAAKTGIMEYRKKTIEEFEKEEQANEEEVKDDLEKIQKEAKKIQDKLRKLREKMLQKKNPEWQDKKELEELLKKQKELQKLFEEAKKKLEENLKKQEEYKNIDESILEKQKQLQKMFEETLSDEQKELLEKIEEMLQEMQKEDMLENMEEMSMSEEKLEKQMDRLLELFKQLEIEKEMQEAIDKLNELAEKQEKLSEETKKGEKSSEELKKEQEALNKEFEKVKEKVADLMKKNKELETPKNLAEDNEEKMDEIKQDMDESQEQLQQNKPQQASQSQKNAAQKMKSMANSLNMQMQGSSQQQHEEDIKALRQLLENILTLSFDQEKLMNKTDGVIVHSPAFERLLKNQYKIKEDFKIVEDSLFALSKRVPEIETFVFDKVDEIKKGLKEGIYYFENDGRMPGRRDFPTIIKHQHEVMKGLNDLALMLDESMQQMQQAGSGMPGSGSCNKPGGKGKKPGKSGNVPMDKIAKGQKNLTESMKKMLNKLKSNKGKGGMAKEFAEAARRQAELRKALEQLQRQKQEEGKGAGNQLQKLIDEMNKIEEDLVNKRLDAEMIKRQQDITSRLLEAEKAERQKGYENKRKSKSAKDVEKKMPPALKKYLEEREAQLQFYRAISPDLKPFYRKLVDDYMKSLKQN